VGIVESSCVTSNVPNEFGRTGEQWNPDGYLVKYSGLNLKSDYRLSLLLTNFSTCCQLDIRLYNKTEMGIKVSIWLRSQQR